MTAISLHLPNSLVKASQKAASHLGLSRSEFIRQAITHELQHLQSEMEQQAMAQAFNAIKKNKKYLKELSEIDDGFSTLLPNERSDWWK